VRVLVVAAMDREVRPLARTLSLQRAFIGDQPAWLGATVAVAVVGVGPDVAGRTTRALLAEFGHGDGSGRRLNGGYGVERVLVVGVAGAVDPSLAVGDVVVPVEVVDRSTGARFRPDPLPGLVTSGVLATTPHLLGPDAVAELRTAGVAAVDMETAAVAGACDDAGVPWSVVRAVSDRLADGLVDDAVLRLTRPDGTTNPAAVAAYLLRRPWRIGRLAKLGAGTGKAVRAVTRAAAAACQDLQDRQDR